MNHLIRITPENEHCFFGYYDKTPWNTSENKLFVTKTTITDRLPTVSDTLEIGYIDFANNNRYKKLASTVAWNFQQGCMLQWLSDSSIIFNDVINGKCFSRIISLSDHNEKHLNYPIYSVSHNKKIAMSVDFARIQQFRLGYGYAGITFTPNDDDGIRVIDLDTQFSKM